MTAHLDLPTPSDLQKELQDLCKLLSLIVGSSEMLQELAEKDGRQDLIEGLASVGSAGLELSTLLADTRSLSLSPAEGPETWTLLEVARSPMSRVIGFADLILAEPAESGFEAYKGDIGKIREAATLFWAKSRSSQIVIKTEAVHDLHARLGAGMEQKRLRDLEQASLQALDAERNLLSVTLQTLVNAVVTTDAEGRIVLFNRVAAEFTGLTEDSARGQSFAAIFPLFDRSQNQIAPDIALEAMRLNSTIDAASSAMKTPRGERIMSTHAAPIPGPKGELLGSVVVIRDVTEKEKIAEEVLRSSKLESIGVLAGGLAHDFNNMLTSVMGNLSLIRHSLEQSPEVLHHLNQAEEGALRARDLAQYLLTFSEGGAPMKKLVETGGILRETTEFVVRGSRVDCDFDLLENLWKVEADPGQLSQAISNIVMNASQAMPEGGTIFLTAENIRFEEENPALLPAGLYVSITISDTGSGIAPEHLPRIYDPFFTTRNQARGLGLAAAYSIINRHGGLIEVESTPGFGTKVHLVLPASNIDPTPMENSEFPAEAKPFSLGRPQRVLVMDDEASIREVCENLLHLLDYEVVTAADGNEALNIFNQAEKDGIPFDLLITDLTVPGGMGGAEMIRRLREGGSQVRAIVSSGYSNGPVMSNPTQYGFNGILPKPYRLHDLEAVLEKVAT